MNTTQLNELNKLTVHTEYVLHGARSTMSSNDSIAMWCSSYVQKIASVLHQMMYTPANCINEHCDADE